MPGNAVVRVENIEKHFGSITAVNDVSFDVAEGEFFSLLGPSGCGKTTTLRLIAGFEQPDSGAITIADDRMDGVPPYERDTGMVFQNYALFPHKTVGENVGFGLKMDGVPKAERTDRIAEYLELVDLPHLENRSPDELSGGQQQRVALARALITEPSVLLLDEPLSNLDLKLRKQMRFELQRIQSQLNLTTIYVTHDQEEALSMSDRVLVMNNGQAEQISSPYDLYNRPTNTFVADFIGDTNLIQGEIVDAPAESNAFTVKFEHSDTTTTVPLGNWMAQNDETAPRDGQAVSISLRPEDLRVGNNPDSGGITCSILATTFIGKATRLLLDHHGQEIVVEMTGKQAQMQEADHNETITIEWESDDCIVLPQ